MKIFQHFLKICVILNATSLKGGNRMPRRRIRWSRILLFLLALAGAVWAWRIFSDPRIPIALDAGHGGDDPGASGIIGETQLTEATVRALASYLEADPSYRVILCRDLNQGAGLNSRWKKANFHRAQLLLSVHGNSAEDSTASGFEAYPAPPGRENHAESLRFANLLASRMTETGIRLRGEEGIRYAYYVDSVKVLQDPSAAPLDAPSFAMVDYPSCPAVLVEQCFVTNPEDVKLLGTETGCQTAAWQYYLAICDYFGTQPQTGAVN